MPLIRLLLSGGAIYAGLKTYLQPLPAAKPRGEEPPVASPPDSRWAWATQIDETYQTFIQQQIDPLLAGKTRQQRLTLLSEWKSRPPISQLERQNNRYLGIAGGVMDTALAGSFLFPPLLIPAVIMVAYLMLDLYQQTFQNLFHTLTCRLRKLPGH